MPQPKVAKKRTGQRIHFVTLHEGVSVDDPLGGRSQIWPEYGRAWAGIDAEAFVISESQSSVVYSVTFPYRLDVVEKHDAGIQQRVIGGGRTMQVLEVVDSEQRHVQLTLHCADAGA